MNRYTRCSGVKPGDLLRYAAGGRPDARVAAIERDGIRVEYTNVWEHPGINRPIVGQFISKDEQGEWRKAA